jgi:HAD superfamily hydrolase (TIGR01490 family)
VTQPSTGRVAFFDVDETLTNCKTMVDFWCHWTSLPGAGPQPLVRGLDGLLRSGLPRAELNRAYYQLFTGVRPERLREAGLDWYAHYRARPRAFVRSGIEALAGHRAAGDTVVLLSGSFHAVLDPLAEDLGVDLVLCTRQTVSGDGTLSGHVDQPMIGLAKAEAASRVMADLRVRPADCFAYGDDISDLPLLLRVGNPVVVGGDDLAREADLRGWPALRGGSSPLSAAAGV